MAEKPMIAVLGSHSALDVCRGAKDEGFKTLVFAERGREKTYAEYYATREADGCVDECVVMRKFSDMLNDDFQKKFGKKNMIFIPNRSFEAYLNFDYQKIEQVFSIPMFGNKSLLKIEERSVRPNQYDLLDEAKIRYPKHFATPAEIDRLALVKVPEKERAFERAFFLVNSAKDFAKKSSALVKSGKISAESLKTAVIEEYVAGTHVNFNFFYSPLKKRLELLGTDTRRQTNLDGLLRLPGEFQQEVIAYTGVSYEESGHIAVTVLESMLEPAFKMGEAFVRASQELFSPGVIGPFALQSIIIPGPPKKEIVVVDISPRMPGSPGIAATPYGTYLHGQPVTAGRRVAQEIQLAWEQNKLTEITS